MLKDFSRDLELIDRLETDYLRILYYDLSPKFNSIYKSYEYSRLCTIIEGEKHVSINNGNNFTYNPGQFILLPPHSNIHMDIEVPTKALVFELNSDLLKKVTEKISIDYEVNFDSLVEDRFFLGKINQDMTNCLSKIANTIPKPNRNLEFLLDLYAQELVYNLVQIKGILQVLNLEQENPVNKAIKYMQANFMQSISIRQIASDLNMSETNFSQYFKKITGITPKEYLTGLKLSKAKDMIKNQNVTEVAFDLGYENISHFISLFKNKYGITPKQYKKVIEQ
jgi:AraC-type DNA-binding domain-containing proteins